MAKRDYHTEKNRYVSVMLKDHPLAAKPGWQTHQAHRVALYAHIGEGPHPCHWCGTELRWIERGQGAGGPREGALVVDHVDGDTRNNALENLVPSCHFCNVWRDNPNAIEPGELFIVRKNGDRTRADKRECPTCGEDFLCYLNSKIRFCSKECSARRGCTPERIAQVAAMRGNGVPAPEIGKVLGVSAATVYRWLREEIAA